MCAQAVYTQPPDNESDTFQIMVATDTHLGYKESDALIKNDSFDAFEEVLQLATKYKVDFMLHSGDFFDEKKLSKETLERSLKILNKYVPSHAGSSDEQSRHKFVIGRTLPTNLTLSSISIALPIFMIHGNHDDPSGLENVSNVDILAANNLVNYYGKFVNWIKSITLTPLLLIKGETKLAIYFLGYYKDEMLNIAFENGDIKFERPKSDASQERNDWFSILLVHQNKYRGMRAGVSKRNSVQEKIFPSFLNLVIWGHEHECITEPSVNADTGVIFLYPGSTVITSLSDYEAKPKHCFIVRIQRTKLNITPIPLERARPFIYKSVIISDYNNSNQLGIIPNLQRIVDGLLQQYNNSLFLPLMRIKIDYTGCDLMRTSMLETVYKGKVANPQSMFQLNKKRKIDTVPALVPEMDDIKSDTEELLKNGQSNTIDQLNVGISGLLSGYTDQVCTSQFIIDIVTNEVAGTSSVNFESIFSNIYDQIILKNSQVIFEATEQNTDTHILFISRNYLDFNLDFSKKGRQAKKISDETLESSFKCAGPRKIGEMDMFLQKAGDSTSKKVSPIDDEIHSQWNMPSSNTTKLKKKPKKM